MNTASYDLLVGVDLNNLRNIKVGNQVKLYSENINGEWIGIVSRVGSKIDAQTQMVNIYISVSGDDLKEGMFLSAKIALQQEVNGIEIPRKLLIDESFVYILKNEIVEKVKIDILQSKENTVITNSLHDGCLLIMKTSGIHKGIVGKAVL